jgi:hypothetical protein
MPNIIMLSAITLGVIMLNVVILSVIMPSAVMVSVIMLSVVMVSAGMLSIVMMNVVLLSVMDPSIASDGDQLLCMLAGIKHQKRIHRYNRYLWLLYLSS